MLGTTLSYQADVHLLNTEYITQWWWFCGIYKHWKLILKDSDDGVQHLILLSFRALSIVQYSKNRIFWRLVSFNPQVKGYEAPNLLGLFENLERSSHWGRPKKAGASPPSLYLGMETYTFRNYGFFRILNKVQTLSKPEWCNTAVLILLNSSHIFKQHSLSINCQ